MDHHEERMIRERADGVRQHEHDPPRPRRHQPRDRDLQGDDARRPPERDRVGTDQLTELGMTL